MNTVIGPYARRQRGSVLIIAMIMVSLLAGLTLSYALRITSDEGRMEVDLAAAYAMEIAESANNWNQERIYNVFDTQNLNYKLGTTTVAAIPWLATVLRTTDTGNPGIYDMIGGSGSTPFNTLWTTSTTWVKWGPGDVKMSAKLILPSDATGHYALVEFKSWARFPDAMLGRYIEREIRRVIKYSTNGNNKVYDFAYFANNYGWMYGTPIYISGSMGSNGDIGFSGNPTVNGDLYAATNGPLGAPGKVNGSYLTQSSTSYLTNPSGMAASDPSAWNNLVLPGNPAYKTTNAQGQTTQIDFPLGFSGTSTKNQYQNPLDMPYLGDLSYYKQEANAFQRPANPAVGDAGGTGGQVKQLKAPGLDPTDPNNYNIIINTAGNNAVYGDNAATDTGVYTTWQANGTATQSGIEVGLANMAKPLTDIPGKQAFNGNLALIGTPEQPIVISGPVVVTNDLVIRGVIKGQGTFFVGRNTHVVGDITYSDNPNWRDPTNTNNSTNISNPNFVATEASNQSKDIVGFATKGSIVLGQYHRTDDSWNTCKSTYFNTGFQNNQLQSYQIDPTDAAIGYLNTTYNSAPCFTGNYTKPVQVDMPNTTAYPGGKTAYSTNAWNAAPSGVSAPYMLRYPDVANWDNPRPDNLPPWNATVPPNFTTPPGTYQQTITFMESVYPNDYIQKMSTAGTGASATTKFLGPGNAGNTATNNAIIRPATISGIYYTNHLFGGRIGNNSYGVKLYGTMVARDEGCVFNTKCQFTYDPRVSTKNPSSHVNIYVPQGTAFNQVSWEEITPGQ